MSRVNNNYDDSQDDSQDERDDRDEEPRAYHNRQHKKSHNFDFVNHYHEQTEKHRKKRKEKVGDSFDLMHPCDGFLDIIPTLGPLTKIARIMLHNCIYVSIAFIILVIILRSFMNNCYKPCADNVLVNWMDQIPIIGTPIKTLICFFACFWLGLFNGVWSFFIKLVGVN
jgi:hypothetical protein